MKRALLACLIAFLAFSLPKVGEQFTYKVKLSIASPQGKMSTTEMMLIQKIKAVGKDQSYVVEITPKFTAQPSQKQPPQQLNSFSLKIDRNGKATLLTQQQNPLLTAVPPSFTPFFAAVLPLPQKFSKGSSLKLTDPNNPRSFIELKHLGESLYKGKKCAKIFMKIPQTSYSMSSPQSSMKMDIKGNGTFLTPLGDNRILQGKFTIFIHSKGYYYSAQNKKINV
ncbi:MAG: hypothetical protein ACPLPS_02800, partial [bacterium]